MVPYFPLVDHSYLPIDETVCFYGTQWLTKSTTHTLQLAHRCPMPKLPGTTEPKNTDTICSPLFLFNKKR